MLIKDARTTAADWVRQSGAAAAFLTGSTLGRADAAELPSDSDLDVVVVSDGPAPSKIGKLVHRGVRLDVSHLAADVLADAESVARTHYLAPSFATPRAILVDDGRLRALVDHIGPHFAEPEMIMARCSDVITRMEAGLAGVGTADSWAEQLQDWIFPISLPTQVLLVAGLRPPTVRLRYLRVRDLLQERERVATYEELLDLLGCRTVDAAVVRHHLAALDRAFTAAARCPPTGFAFGSDITGSMRDATVGATIRLVDAGHPREAVFWLMVTLVRCQLILDRVGEPTTRDHCAAALRSAAGDVLGVLAPQDLRRRADRLRAWTGTLRAEAERVIGTR